MQQTDACSCDPNNKMLVSPKGCGELGFISNQELTYTIFFQNLGTGNAHDIFIVDTLDSDLDITSLQIIASSHTITNIEILNNVLIVSFDSIELPPLINDTAGSIGFLTYNITPFQGLPDETTIENSAAIFFDSLSPVITNTVINTIVDEPVPIVDAGEDQTVFIGYNNELCVALIAAVTGGLPPYSFIWSNGETTQTITVCPEETTTYTVTVIDVNGCSSSDEVTVNVIDVRCGNNLNKVLVCHIPPGNPDNPQTICISPNAVPIHLAQHGDYLGPCVDSFFTEPDTFFPRYGAGSLNLKIQSSGTLLKIYPNPFKNSTTIEYYLPEEVKNTKISIYDIISGTKMKSYDIVQPGFGKLIIDASDLIPGMYFYGLYVDDSPVSVKKFFIIE